MDRTIRLRRFSELLHKAIPLMLFSDAPIRRDYINLFSSFFVNHISDNDIGFKEVETAIVNKLSTPVKYNRHQRNRIDTYREEYLSLEERIMENHRLIMKLEEEINLHHIQKINPLQKNPKVLPKVQQFEKCPECGGKLKGYGKKYGIYRARCTKCGKGFPVKDDGTLYRCTKCGSPLSGTGKVGKCIKCERRYNLQTMEQVGFRVQCAKCRYKWTYVGKSNHSICKNCETSYKDMKKLQIKYDF